MGGTCYIHHLCNNNVQKACFKYLTIHTLMIIPCTNVLCVKFSGMNRFYHGSVDTPIDGVDTGSESLKVFHEDRVKCVDTVHGHVDSRPSF